jgi:hypothetical protein
MEIESGGAQTDVGMFDFQLNQHHKGIYFYERLQQMVACRRNSRVPWIRRMDGCGIAPLGGSLLIGRRWLAVTLLPSQSPHLP